MKHHMAPQDLELATMAINEIRTVNAAPPVRPAIDTDMVWGISAPGTFYDAANDGSYSGASFDRQILDHSLGIVTEITANRLGKEPKDVTKADIEVAGPIFYYNSEDSRTANVNYPQNEHLARAVESGEFPLPSSKVVIDTIPTIGTPGQIEGIATYLREQAPHIGKIAVVSGIAHSVRVGRYLEHYRSILPANVEFTSLTVPQPHNPAGIVLREVRKAVQYANAGHLDRVSYFHPQKK